MLNNINKPIVKLFAAIQNEVADTADCSTLEMECAHMVAGGKERIYLNQLAVKLSGNLINRVKVDIVPEEEITVYATSESTKQPRPRQQSLNKSLLMVASYSVLMSGYTSQAIIESALINWADMDSIETEQDLDFKVVAVDIVKAFQKVNILSMAEEVGQLDTGERFKGYAATQDIQDLRIETMIKMWDNAQPKMKPMKHKLTWNLNGTCELKNLVIGLNVKEHFIGALNKAGHTGYTVNPAIRAQIKRNIKKRVYADEQLQTMKALLSLELGQVYYFPHTPDYRGRFYARGGLTTFQGVKDLRAAFDFAQATKVDEYGLFLHIANAYGNDKDSITNRIQWVRDSHMALMSTPAPTLYAERARLAYIEYKETGLSNIVCRIDGTCSGIQITSGLYLDKATAAAVNVCASSPDDMPSDIYGLVAEAALKLAKKGTDKAIIAKYKRDLTKKVIMILAYGAGIDTRINTVKEFLLEVGERSSHAKSLHKLIMQAIANNYQAITRLNDDLQLELEDQPLAKISYQLSDMVVTFKPTTTEHLNLYGSDYTAKLVGKRLPDPAGLARGIAPNFVHSLDSELLRIAVNNIGSDVSCIHDDLGVQSGMVRKALQEVRTAYYEVIAAEPLKELYRGMDLLEEYEPENNGLDLRDVLESSYMFS